MKISDNKENRPDTGAEVFNDANEVEYEQVLENIGFGKTQWVLLFISGLLTLTSLAAQQAIGIIAIASQCEFETNQSDKGVMMAACVTGIFLSTYIWGYISDAIGRRTVLVYGTLVACLLQFISMFITNVWFFNFINLVMGISLAGVTSAIYAYLSEFNTSKYRAIVINYSTMFVSVAAIYVPASSWLVLSADWSITVWDGFVFQPWRLIILLTLMPGLIGALMLLPFPESPKLLLTQHKDHEALEAVNWICKFNTGHTLQERFNYLELKLKNEFLSNENILGDNRGWNLLVNIWKDTKPLFQKPHRKNVIMSITTVFCLFFSCSGMQVWFPEIVNRSSGDGVNNNSETVCEILDASFIRQNANTSASAIENTCDSSISNKTYVDNIIVGCAFLLGFIVQGALLNPIGRKNVIFFALATSTISGLLLHVVANSTLVLILFCLYILMPGLSISVMCGALVDMLPTNLRGKAVSIAFTLGRLGIVLAANLIGLMLEPLCNTTFAVFTASMIVAAVLIHLLPV